MAQEPASSLSDVLIVAGEASGETYAAELVSALTRGEKGNKLGFFGCGGERMRQAGVETIVDIRRLAVLGPLEVTSHLWHLYVAMRCLVEETKRRRPLLAILVDFPDFNMRLAKSLKVLRIPIVYFISPQVWAWRSRRIHQIKALVDRMIVVLPFEKEFYARFGMEVDYVGHPLLDRVYPTCSRDDFLKKHALQSSVLTVSLLPGSRTKEVKYHLPILFQAARSLVADGPLQFLIPLASTVSRCLVQKIWREEAPALPLKIIEDETYNAVASSDLAVVGSGTATLETALLGTPLIAVFRISTLTWIIGQYLVDVPHYCLVNLIAGKRLVPELYQKEFNAERLCHEMRRYLGDPTFRDNARIELARLRDQLGSGGAISKAAERIREWLSGQSSRLGGEV
jgi:lipid-A-disaccharide synthase